MLLCWSCADVDGPPRTGVINKFQSRVFLRNILPSLVETVHIKIIIQSGALFQCGVVLLYTKISLRNRLLVLTIVMVQGPSNQQISE